MMILIEKKMIVRICFGLIPAILFLSACKNSSSGNRTETTGTQQPVPLPVQTVLHEAALNGQAEAVDSLLEQGIDVNALDQDGRTALMYAAFNGYEGIVTSLVAHDAGINIKDNYGRTPLMFAATGPFPGTVRMLLDHKAEIDAVDAEEHFTALMYAAAEGQLEVVEILLEYGADAALRDVDGDTAETFARNNGHTEVADVISEASR
jgi:ankyrin repeat protein